MACPAGMHRRSGPEAAAERLTAELVAVVRRSVAAMILYGSRLHGAAPDARSAVDFIVVVDAYRPFYRALAAAGAVHRAPALLTVLSHLLPPTSIAFRPVDGMTAKCLVVSRAHLAEALGTRARDHFLLARLLQPSVVTYTRDDVVAQELRLLLDGARSRLLSWLAPFLDLVFDAEQVARRMVEVSYRHELRPEPPARAAEVYATQREPLRAMVHGVLARALENRDVVAIGEGRFRMAQPLSRARARRIRWRLGLSNLRSVARWPKYALTFHNWLPYIAAKVERRTGRAVDLSAREQRWPLLFIWPRLIATFRSPEVRARIRRATVRQSIAFLRDPAAFTSGPGYALGDLYQVRAPRGRVFIVTDPLIVEDILVREQRCFAKSRIYWSELRRSFGASMGALDGEEWEERHVAQRPSFTPRAVEGIAPELAAVIDDHLQGLLVRVGAGGELPVFETFSALNARVMLEALFGRRLADVGEADGVAQQITAGHDLIAWRSRYPWRPWLSKLSGGGRASALADRLRTYGEEIAESSAAEDPGRLLHALVRSATRGRASSSAAHEIIFHLAASTETQAAAEAWTVHLLWQHPDVLHRLRAEVASVAPHRAVGVQHLPALAYCRQVILEALRLHPPVYAILRDCVTPTTLGALQAVKGDAFVISVYGLHRHPRHWTDPERFDPDRFAGAAGQIASRFHYLPFGAGRRVCIGRHLAMTGMVLTVARFAQIFDWTFGAPVVSHTRSSLKPPPGLPIFLAPREVPR